MFISVVGWSASCCLLAFAYIGSLVSFEAVILVGSSLFGAPAIDAVAPVAGFVDVDEIRITGLGLIVLRLDFL